MRSLAVLAFLAIAIVGVGVTLALAAGDDRDIAFTLSVAPDIVAAEIPPGGVACQTPVSVAQSFRGVRFQVGTYHRPGPPLTVTIRRRGNARPITSGRLPGGYPDISRPTVVLDREVTDGRRVGICVRNRGGRKVALYGGPELARRRSTAELGGRDQRTDLTLVFTKNAESALATAPEIFERASLFRPDWVGPWTYWLLAGLVLLLAPVLLARALRDAFSAADASASDGRAGGDREGAAQA